MTDFNLRQIARDVLTSSTMADPRDLAAEVFRRIAAEDYGTALAQCLPDVVREEIRSSRNHPSPAEPMTERLGSVGGGSRPPTGRSAKVAAIRTYWQSRLLERLHVGPVEWGMLGDCGFDHLMFAAAERRAIASRNTAKAQEYEDLAHELRAAGVNRVRDLPAQTLQARLEGEAA